MFGDIAETIREGGLFGSTSGKVSPWAEDLAKLEDVRALDAVKRQFDIDKLTPDQLTHAKKVFQEGGGASDLIKGTGAAQGQGFSGAGFEGARRGFINRNMREAGNLAYAFNPVNTTIGNQYSRVKALDDFYNSGLLGANSTIMQNFHLGEGFGKGVLPTAYALSKPLVAGGLLFPAMSIGDRIMNPEAQKDSLAKGVMSDAGWYAGSALGLPFGALGMSAGSLVGKQLGDFAGDIVAGSGSGSAPRPKK